MKIVYVGVFDSGEYYSEDARRYVSLLSEKFSEEDLKIYGFSLFQDPRFRDLPFEDIYRKHSFASQEVLNKYLSENKGEYILFWHIPPSIVNILSKLVQDPSVSKNVDLLFTSAKSNINIVKWAASDIPYSWVESYRFNNTSAVIVSNALQKEKFEKAIVQEKDLSTQVFTVPEYIPEIKKSASKVDLSNDNFVSKLKDKFVIYSKFKWGDPFSGFDKLLISYYMEFGHQKDVVLVLQTYTDDGKYQVAKDYVDNIIKRNLFMQDGFNPTAELILVPFFGFSLERQKALFANTDIAIFPRRDDLNNKFAVECLEQGVRVAISRSQVSGIGESKLVSGDWVYCYGIHSIYSMFTISEYDCDMKIFEPRIGSLRNIMRHNYLSYKKKETIKPMLGESERAFLNKYKSKKFIADSLVNVVTSCIG